MIATRLISSAALPPKIHMLLRDFIGGCAATYPQDLAYISGDIRRNGTAASDYEDGTQIDTF